MWIIPNATRDYVMSRDGHLCNQCPCGVPRLLQIDHVIPVWHLRNCKVPEPLINATWNLQVLCHACNQKKGAGLPDRAAVERIRERDHLYQLAQQKGVDTIMEGLFNDPDINAFLDVWEHTSATSADLDRRVDRDLDPNDFWRADVREALMAGITNGELWDMVVRAHAKADTSAWGYFRRMLDDWMSPAFQDETLFDERL